ncbi:hypothetical protein [Pseudomonas mandelii]|uniref:hypothetical protein n=1 Tax=Pseudomonas mandelii TaxID=75612 RepID=UPI0020A1B782|nr:hypothetical protein [Pseudomonas mandelii]MCO8312470.1 hypothetical protein [Pseudomonas mandelii]
MKNMLCASLLAFTAMSVQMAQAGDASCNARYNTVVFVYPKPVGDPIYDKLSENAKSMRDSSPESILDATFGKGLYEVVKIDDIPLTANGEPVMSEKLHNDEPVLITGADGKPKITPTHTGWRYVYTGEPVDDGVRTDIRIERFDKTPVTGKPMLLHAKWTAIVNKAELQDWTVPSYPYGFVTQMDVTDCPLARNR